MYSFVATRDCEYSPVLCFFSCFASRKVSLISTFCYRAWVSFLSAFCHMRILSVIRVSASRYVIVIVNFGQLIRFIVFSPV